MKENYLRTSEHGKNRWIPYSIINITNSKNLQELLNDTLCEINIMWDPECKASYEVLFKMAVKYKRE